MGIVFTDIETTGLDPNSDAIIEIALILDDYEKTYWIELTPEELGSANSNALAINRFYERKDPRHHLVTVKPEARQQKAIEIAEFTAGHILAGNTVKFDQAFLAAWMRRHGAAPVWDYHILDVPTYAAAWLNVQGARLRPPFKSHTVSDTLGGIDEPKGRDKHTALADAKWSKAVWDKVTSGERWSPPPPPVDPDPR